MAEKEDVSRKRAANAWGIAQAGRRGGDKPDARFAANIQFGYGDDKGGMKTASMYKAPYSKKAKKY